MHFYYLDESGCTGRDLENREQPIFVLGGLSVRDVGWNQTQEEMVAIIDDYFGGCIPEGFELHSTDLLSLNGEGFFAGHERDRREALAKKILGLLLKRSHDVHYYAINKVKMLAETCSVELPYDIKTPYLVSYDYLITHINWFLKERLGVSARGMFIIDTKEEFLNDIEMITNSRRFSGAKLQRIKWIVEFSYPIDSHKNPMIQICDLVVFCIRKFLEIEGGYRGYYAEEAKRFYAECYELICNRMPRSTLVERQGRNMASLNSYLRAIQAKPTRQWRKKYGLT
jgi:hypothetical protein